MGYLDVVVGVLWDHYDSLAQKLNAELATTRLSDAKQLAEFNARQGALLEVERLALRFTALGERQRLDDAAPAATVALGAREPTPRPRKRPIGR